MLKGKNVLVFGACGLLGAEILASLLREGANVVGVDLKQQTLLTRFGSLLDSHGSQLELVAGDVTDENMLQRIFDMQGKLDGVVNCTYPRNSRYGRSLLDVKIEDFNENINIHLGSAFMIMQQTVKYFEKHGRPLSLVNIASVYGVIAPKFEIYDNTPMTMPVEYAAIKSAIIRLTEYIVAYVKNSDFRANCVSPGGLKDGQPAEFLTAYQKQTSGKGMLDPQDLSGTIIYLLSEYSKYVTGQNIIVDDGFTL